ncbi:hypothetical protein ABZV75_35740 [Streptomyces flaveolus]|uniref:effector-associated constant component EACC1 n=1 Tax=Streptomyces flaveolus TaxID=67297 RepID=UPI00339F1E0F
MRVLADGDEESLVELQSWLAADPGTARLKVATVTGDGPTMGALEALDVILGGAVDIANFALAFATWRSTRHDGRRGPTGGDTGAHRLVHGESTVDIGHLSPEELGDLLRRLDDTATAAADE